MNGNLVLPDSLLDVLSAEARSAGDSEICGFLCANGCGWIRYPMTNRAAHTETRFEIDPGQQIAAFKHMRKTGARLSLIYHSHPHGEARPSARDIRGHSYPRACALIIAPRALDGEPIRAWHMAGPVPHALPLRRSSAPWHDTFL